ncbi:hypothetical protein [uncultured Jatrophihabitans sp.]|uniref:hypothetical protein n=1 Tax=uncultured Jatrophihabitans sp. TaxID=1610747 RepID=UPI0035C9CB47
MSTVADVAAEHNLEPVSGCMICEQAFADDRKIVLDTEQFRSYVTEVYPWCVMLVTRRHDCDGPWALNEAEGAELGKIIPQLSQAIRAMGNERVYVLNFGEDIPIPHYHLGFFSRWEAISEATHEVLYARAKEVKDPVQVASDFAKQIRDNLG